MLKLYYLEWKSVLRYHFPPVSPSKRRQASAGISLPKKKDKQTRRVYVAENKFNLIDLRPKMKKRRVPVWLSPTPPVSNRNAYQITKEKIMYVWPRQWAVIYCHIPPPTMPPNFGPKGSSSPPMWLPSTPSSPKPPKPALSAASRS